MLSSPELFHTEYGSKKWISAYLLKCFTPPQRNCAALLTMHFHGISTTEHEQFLLGGPDANGQPPLKWRAEGRASPCRHCLGLISPGQEMLVLSYRPFVLAHPYAETGPIFLHASPCKPYDAITAPAWFDFLEPALVRGYGTDNWIRYDTARVVAGREIDSACQAILADSSVAYVHVRSKYNCFQCRVDRA